VAAARAAAAMGVEVRAAAVLVVPWVEAARWVGQAEELGAVGLLVG
tara:strand:+ start:6013 stop:6150 length:138 start_codon:yes stop_codon:yes gene_type:complete